MESPQISTDFPIMCFFGFELLTEVEEELMSRISITFRCASFHVHVFSVSTVFKVRTEITFVGEEDAVGNHANTRRALQIFVGRRGQSFDLFEHCLKCLLPLFGDRSEISGSGQLWAALGSSKVHVQQNDG